jgi:2-keto-4-pentenoate hydratase/2-oxohepta-3-ene-1,7-dioic acid hydratase in catechol pathway
MRIARFEGPDGQTFTGQLLDEHAARPLTSDSSGRLTFADDTLAVGRLLPPVEPPNIFAVGRNYRAHIEETGARRPENPLIFMKPTTALLAPGDPIVLPDGAPDEVDFEAELAIVVGRTARRVPQQAALGYVLGYTCANDVSARNCQRDDKQWSRAKGFDTFCPLGPWLVTADELDPDNCAIRSRLNGRIMQDSSTSNMIHSCARLVSYLSHQFTLLPGTVILTGTPEGVGFARTPPVFLRDGDRIEVEIDGIGSLVNTVTAEQGRCGKPHPTL